MIAATKCLQIHVFWSIFDKNHYFFGKIMIFWVFGTLNAFGPFLSHSKSSEVHVCEIPSRFEIFFMVQCVSQKTPLQFHGGDIFWSGTIEIHTQAMDFPRFPC